MRVLIITYYWPPAGGSGVQRWLHFVKYLHEFGIEPVVFTIANPNYPIEDISLYAQIPKGIEVIKQKIWEPNAFFGKKKKQTGAGFLQQNPSFLQKLILYIRANYFIPDARKFWIRPSVRTITKYLKSNPVDWIITTGPPHSAHLIGRAIKEKTNTKWLADFRDPWTEIDYFYQLPLSKKSLQKHHKLALSVLLKADIVTVVSNTMQEKYTKLGANCHVITNGYDGEVLKDKPKLDTKFTLTHIGMLNADRNPIIFWQILAEIIEENKAFKKLLQINLIGKIADEVTMSLRKYQLEQYVNLTTYIPHDAIQAHQEKSQILLLFVNNVPSAKGIVTGKIFEYLRAQRPILALAPTDGDLANIITATNTGKTIEFTDTSVLKKEILAYFDAFQKGSLQVSSKEIEKYHRKNLTSELVKLLSETNLQVT